MDVGTVMIRKERMVSLKKQESKQGVIAYFCMEYGLESSFKIYSGGLGILAGDHLKACKDKGLPVVGIGIKWEQGYVEQYLDKEGAVTDCYRNINCSHLEDTGTIVEVIIREEKVPVKVWKTEAYGNVPLLLLDTNISGSPHHGITKNLYGGNSEDRVAQEIVLGAGGIKALRAMGYSVNTYHFNEGHAVIAGLELIAEKMSRGVSFHDAWEETKKEIVFTTHTPVEAGNETHPISRFLYMNANQGLTIEQLIEIGGAPFNMTVAGLRLSRKVNTVAELHLETTKKMWKSVTGKAPMINITNGVHLKTWMDDGFLEQKLEKEKCLELHQKNKKNLIKLIEERTGAVFQPEKLTIGFARRMTPYKRSDLIFSDRSKIDLLLKQEKIQLVFSGKAHPMDNAGKEKMGAIYEMQKKYPNAIVFLQNYDMEIGALITRGCDVWLNNPQRPKEACGTSGMKAAMNGVLNLSILDGWWPEACQHGVNGWAIGDVITPKTEEQQDQKDAKALYEMMEKEVIPLYYENTEKWADMMLKSIETTKEAFSAERMVDEYWNKMYKPKKGRGLV
ncbi:starch phosphorylase [Tindallia californiensis]|uniref:glycogen phosphorylase n=1 Tax=Tindallia californiensis TaxID=159292 RepID=A0A1H3R3N6_9FIRM|nr:starch phosphorylase [Tindallia californiensis]